MPAFAIWEKPVHYDDNFQISWMHCLPRNKERSVQWQHFFPFGIRYIYSHSAIAIKIAISVKTSLFYWQTVFKSTLFPHRHIFHATQQIQWKLQFMFSTKKKQPKNTPKLSLQTNKHCHSLHNQTDKFDPNLSLTKPFVTWPQEGWTREKISPISPSLGRCQQGSLCEQSHLECFKCLGAHTDLPDVPEFNTLVNSSVTIHHYSFEIKK